MLDDESYHFKHEAIGALGMSKKNGVNHTALTKFYVTTNYPLSHLDRQTVIFGRVV